MKLSEYYLENSKNGLSKSFKDSDEGVRIVNMKELFGYNPITDSVEMRQVLLTNSELDRFGLKYNDLLFGRRSLMYEGSGKTTIYKGSLPTVFESSIIRVRLDEEKLNPDFANYYFNSKVGRGNVLSIVTGAAVFGIRGSDLSNLKIGFPSLDTQKRIASILSAYDDLIENNNQRIQLLEEMAEEIYQEWFVRFRFPNYKNTKFLDKDGNEVAHGTKGAIPDGWEEMKLYDVFDINYGKNLAQTEILENGEFPVYGASGVMGYYHDYNCFNKVVLITSRGNGSGDIHRTREAAFVTNNSFIAFPKKKYQNIKLSFIHEFFKMLHIERFCTGSAQPQLTNHSLENFKIQLPDENIITRFCEIGDPLFDEIDLLLKKNQILQETRDLLLPRLISGKLSVEGLELENTES